MSPVALIPDQWLDQLDTAQLECDGVSRCLSTLLDREDVQHEVHLGWVEVEGRCAVTPHFWIQLSGFIVDLRLRMWLGNRPEFPHGVFAPDERVRHHTERILVPHETILQPGLFYLLSGRHLENFKRLDSTV